MRTLPTYRSTARPSKNIYLDRGRLSRFPTRSPRDRIRCQQSCDRARAVSGNGTHRALVPNEDARWCCFAVGRLRPVRLCLERKVPQRSLSRSETSCECGLSRTRQPIINDESLKNPLGQKPSVSEGARPSAKYWSGRTLPRVRVSATVRGFRSACSQRREPSGRSAGSSGLPRASFAAG